MIETAQLNPATYSGRFLWAAFRDLNGLVWNGSAFVAPTQADMVAGAVLGAESPAGSGFFTFTVPAAVVAALYTVVIYLRIGANPATADLSGPVAFGGSDTLRTVSVTQRNITV